MLTFAPACAIINEHSEIRSVQLPQPTSSTEKDIGAENPETTTVSGFFHADF